MATYVNDLRLKEIATGDESGTWGTSTNTNLELIAEAFSFGTEGITTNADTHTTTIADGSTDPGRSLYLKYTGTLDSACTITIGPNTISKLWFIENGTSGSQNIIIKQGSGTTITIPPGDTKAIYSDGAGSGGAMVDAFASLNVVDLKVQDDLTVTDDMTVGGTLGVTGIVTLTDDLIIGDGKTIGSASDVDAMTIAANGQVTFSQTLIGTALDISGDIDVDGTTNLDVVDIDGAVDMATTLAVAGNVDFNGDLDVDGTTNLDVVDIDGAVDMASTLGVTGVVTANAGVVVDNITIDGTQIDLSSGDLTLDVAGDIILDADGDEVFFKRGGVSGGRVLMASAMFAIGSQENNGDFKIMGIDGGADIDALTFDMSAAGKAAFNAGASFANATIHYGNGAAPLDWGDTSTVGQLSFSGSTAILRSSVSDGDMIIQGNDGGSFVAAVTFDMSEAGRAIFNAGVALGGTGAANTLDDYEEGDYDAAVTCASGTITLAGAGDRLSYTKIGRLVHVQGKLLISAISSPSGATTVNLPFAIGDYTDTAGQASSLNYGFFNGSAITDGSYSMQQEMTEGQSLVRLYVVDAFGGSSNIGDNHTAANSELYINVQYST